MVKSTSSASKNTRKKHAAKAGKADEPSTGPAKKQRGQKDKPKRGVPKPYVPPPKAPRGEADPVDVYGLAQSSELVPVVTLRLLAKRDEKTIGRGLEELDAWLADAPDESILIMLPVWVEHFARLAQHADRRVRTLVAGVQARLTARPVVRDELLSARYLEQQASFVGAWACLAFDPDRSVQVVAQRTWQSALDPASSSSLDLATYAPEIVAHVATLLHPAVEGEADEQGDRARLYSAAAAALAWLIGRQSDAVERYEALLGVDSSLWPLLDRAHEASAGVRTATWGSLDALVSAPSLQRASEAMRLD